MGLCLLLSCLGLHHCEKLGTGRLKMEATFTAYLYDLFSTFLLHHHAPLPGAQPCCQNSGAKESLVGPECGAKVKGSV